ncbi:cell surface glycoprotein 1, partial [Patella vulgata]|uniref:cell surface glycoprotein 1 n=1 Tax=Patella vulgata TaxID=6465 RepID=UPI0024A9B29C
MDKSGHKIKPQVAPKPIPPPKRIPRSSSVEDKSAEKDLSKAKKSADVVKDSSAGTDKQKPTESSSGPSKEPPVPPPKTTRGFPNGKPKLFPGPIVHQRLEAVDAHGNKIEKKGKGDNKNKKTDRLQKSNSIETPPSRLKGTGSKSDSDDFSDLASDLDMEEIYGERYRADGASTDDAWDDMSISTVSNDDADGSTFRRKYRPKSLNLSRSHSLTSSDEEESLEAAAASAAEVTTNLNQVPKSKPTHPPPVAKKPDLKLAPIVTEEPKANLMTSSLEIHECKAINSPTPPRSPSWREGLESPPFSPKRKDHYPGKKRSGSVSPTSPKEKRHHFNYSDLSPPSRQPSVDELYGDQGPSKDTTAPLINMAQKPSPLSPEEIPNSIIGTSGEPFSFSMPVRDKFKSDLSCFQPAKIAEDIHDQVQVMDLATYAATIASSTASLTSMSVSPTTLQVNASCYNNEHGSPESNDSPDSNSPVSPGYYDNVSNSGDMEDVELADPSTKSIDYQGSKRQKARPPTTDWSPVIDLSPILDVSPSIEEAEQEDMLMKQREEFLRQKSREEEIERAEAAMAEQDEEEEEEVQPITDEVQPPLATVPPPADQYLYRSLRRYGNFEDMSKIGDNGLTLSTLSDELNGNDPSYHIEDSPPKDEFAMMHCASLAQTLSTESTPHYSKSPVFQGDTVGDSAHHKSVLETITSIEIRKISQDLEDIARKGVAEFKPLPPPKPRRKLPEPGVESTPKKIPPIPAPKPSMSVPKTVATEESKPPTSDEPKTVSDDRQLQKQDSFEKKTAKYLKARPNPILVEHIESEEQSVSPQYKVLDSPPTPEQKPIKREFSESTSVSPSSSPDQDVYMFPSPVTPPDSDSSPPKPHSPSSTGTDLDDDASHKSSRDDLMGLDEPVPTSTAKQSPIKPVGTKPVSQPIPIPSDA